MFLILATGTCSNKPMQQLEQDYLKRLPAAWSAQVQVLSASKHTTPAQASAQESKTQLHALAHLPPGAVRIALTEKGLTMPSTQFAHNIQGFLTQGQRPIVFLIGGAAGLHSQVLQACPHHWSLSALTFPHQLVRPVLAEQLYRAYTLLHNHPYHRT